VNPIGWAWQATPLWWDLAQAGGIVVSAAIGDLIVATAGLVSR
jgi:hypothetical protein